MTPEGRIEKYLKDEVKRTGGHQRKVRWLSRRGAPDQFVWWECHSPVAAFVEVKREGQEPTLQQAREHARLRLGGFQVFSINSREAVDNFISLMLQILASTQEPT